MFVTIFPITFLSNAFARPEGMPPVLRWLAEWNPISALVQALRELWGNEGFPVPPDAALPLQYPVTATLIWTIGLSRDPRAAGHPRLRAPHHRLSAAAGVRRTIGPHDHRRSPTTPHGTVRRRASAAPRRWPWPTSATARSPRGPRCPSAGATCTASGRRARTTPASCASCASTAVERVVTSGLGEGMRTTMGKLGVVVRTDLTGTRARRPWPPPRPTRHAVANPTHPAPDARGRVVAWAHACRALRRRLLRVHLPRQRAGRLPRRRRPHRRRRWRPSPAGPTCPRRRSCARRPTRAPTTGCAS